MLYLLSIAALFSLTHSTPSFSGAEYFVIDTCTNYEDGSGSQICHCSDGENMENLEGSVHCYQYDAQDCTGDWDGSFFYGGCDAENYEYYLVDGCTSAQEAAASGLCEYWVDDNDNTYPIGSCLWGGDGDNCDQGALSCQFACDGDSTVLYYYDNVYDCSETENGSPWNISDGTWNCASGSGNCDEVRSTCGGAANQVCSVRVSTYSHGDYCQSSHSDWDTEQPTSGCNYWENSQSVFRALDTCNWERFGAFEFQYKWVCNADGNIDEYQYFDSSCEDGSTIEDSAMWVSMYNASIYDSASGEEIVCSNTESCDSALFKYTRQGCSTNSKRYNAWSSNYERGRNYGICTPLMDEDAREMPWYSDLYYTVSTFWKNDYRDYFYYHSTDCSERNYVFDYIDTPWTSTVTDKYCGRQIKGYKNGDDDTGKKTFTCD